MEERKKKHFISLCGIYAHMREYYSILHSTTGIYTVSFSTLHTNSFNEDYIIIFNK